MAKRIFSHNKETKSKMPELYKNKYRIPPARAQWWNYETTAAYFITICTADRQPYFGEIIADKMQLSPAGKIAENLWHEIINHAQNIKLGEFIIMPNHIHGIITIDNNIVETRHALSPSPCIVNSDNINPNNTNPCDKKMLPSFNVHETGRALSLQSNPTQLDRHFRFRNQGKNTVSSAIGGYKSAVSKCCRENSINFAWQTRFHDRIIRDLDEHNRIAEYITNNPINWQNDKFYAN